MTATKTDASTFAKEMLTGFGSAHADRLLAIDGGFVSRMAQAGKVAVVVGGGSGHYPAFAGLVGPGLATAAVCGDIFASPSSAQVLRVARAAEKGAGILLSYGNYMGDTLNFTLAQEQLRAQGFDVRTVKVTDDVVSAPAAESHKRRGVAGDLFVFKVAGAAAERGFDLDAVEALANKANAAIRTFGVAFSGCTLPGAAEPLFSVPEGKMSLGLGVHGEPGIGEADLPSPKELAKTLVEPLLLEQPAGSGKRLTVLLNGLGAMKYEELYVVYGYLKEELERLDFEIVAPEVGELVTSLDMSGVSLSLAWLEPELEELWLADCDAPGFKRSRAIRAVDLGFNTGNAEDSESSYVEPQNSIDYSSLTVSLFETLAQTMQEAESELGELDKLVGDGDHGIGMARGSEGARIAVANQKEAGVVELLNKAAIGWSDAGGGTSGAIWGILLSTVAASISRAESIDSHAVSSAFQEASDRVQEIGGASVGDKTLVDALVPFSERLNQLVSQGRSLGEAWPLAAASATEAARDTAALLPKIGRARLHAERSLGHPDAGAISLALALSSVSKHFREAE